MRAARRFAALALARDHAGDVAGAAGGGFQRLVEQAGEALEPLIEILGADVERGDQRVERDAALVDGVLGALVAVVDQLGGLGQLAAVAVELVGQLAEIGDDVRGDVAEVGDVALRPGRWRRRSRR